MYASFEMMGDDGYVTALVCTDRTVFVIVAYEISSIKMQNTTKKFTPPENSHETIDTREIADNKPAPRPPCRLPYPMSPMIDSIPGRCTPPAVRRDAYHCSSQPAGTIVAAAVAVAVSLEIE